MRMMHVLHQCLLLMACAFTFALCWPFKQRSGFRPGRHGQDLDYIPPSGLLHTRNHLPYGRRKKIGFHKNYTLSDYVQKRETFLKNNEPHRYIERPLELIRYIERPSEPARSVQNKNRKVCEQEDGTSLIPCPYDKTQCLYDYMICDDKVDCDGGEDEDPGLCLLRSWVLKWMKKIERSIKSGTH